MAELSELAAPLEHYQKLVEQKSQLARKLGSLTGHDRAYENYLDCALLRKSEYTSGVMKVVEYIKGLRVVT